MAHLGQMGGTITVLPDGRLLLWNIHPSVTERSKDEQERGLLELAVEDDFYTSWLEYWHNGGDDDD